MSESGEIHGSICLSSGTASGEGMHTAGIYEILLRHFGKSDADQLVEMLEEWLGGLETRCRRNASYVAWCDERHVHHSEYRTIPWEPVSIRRLETLGGIIRKHFSEADSCALLFAYREWMWAFEQRCFM